MPHQKTNQNASSRSGGMMNNKILLGTTGVVLTAAAVAAGTAMIDKKTRGKITRGVQRAARNIGSKAKELAQMQDFPIAHEIIPAKKRIKKSSRGRKKVSKV